MGNKNKANRFLELLIEILYITRSLEYVIIYLEEIEIECDKTLNLKVYILFVWQLINPHLLNVKICLPAHSYKNCIPIMLSWWRKISLLVDSQVLTLFFGIKIKKSRYRKQTTYKKELLFMINTQTLQTPSYVWVWSTLRSRLEDENSSKNSHKCSHCQGHCRQGWWEPKIL